MGNVKAGDGQWDKDFPLLEEGEHDMVIQDGIKVIKEETDPTLFIPLKTQDESGDIGCFCILGKTFGVRKILEVCHYSGLAPLIAKQMNLPAADSEEGWDEELVKSDKFIEMLKVKLPGRTIHIDVIQKTIADGKVVANIKSISSAGKGKPATPKTEPGEPPEVPW